MADAPGVTLCIRGIEDCPIVYHHQMNTRISRRTLLAGTTAPMLVPGAAGAKRNRPSAIKLGFQGGISEELLRFMKQIGVEWIAFALRATQGQTLSEVVTGGAVIKGVDGSMGGVGAGPGGPSGPWKDSLKPQ